MSTRVYVGKLPPDVRRGDIEDLFRDYGVSLSTCQTSTLTVSDDLCDSHSDTLSCRNL